MILKCVLYRVLMSGIWVDNVYSTVNKSICEKTVEVNLIWEFEFVSHKYFHFGLNFKLINQINALHDTRCYSRFSIQL